MTKVNARNQSDRQTGRITCGSVRERRQVETGGGKRRVVRDENGTKMEKRNEMISATGLEDTCGGSDVFGGNSRLEVGNNHCDRELYE